MPKNDREVWEYIHSNENFDYALNRLCYAVYASEKYEWVEQFESDHGAPPTLSDIDQWISDITFKRYVGMQETAAALFDDAARKLLRDEIKQRCQRAVDDSILGAVKSASSFWKQAALSLIAAILAPLIIGGMIVAARSYDQFYPTASGVAQTAPLDQHAVPKP